MNRRHFALGAAVAATPLLSGFGWDKHFDLSWEEEVLLHDGRVIVVKLKHTYERLYPGLTRYGGTNLTRDTTLTFDAGGTTGVVTQLFKGFHPMFIGQYEGVWYAVLYGDYYARSREIPGQDWGELEGPYGQWAIKLVGGKWAPISMSNLPDAFQQPNMMMLYGEADEHAAFDGKRVTLSDKRAWLTKHFLGYAHVRLTRPTAASPKRPDARNIPVGGLK
jgi:hypothetical protein